MLSGSGVATSAQESNLLPESSQSGPASQGSDLEIRRMSAFGAKSTAAFGIRSRLLRVACRLSRAYQECLQRFVSGRCRSGRRAGDLAVAG